MFQVSAGGKATKTGAAVLEIQRMLPKARVVYCSATGITEPRWEKREQSAV
jgi:hypothetical protein